jgi:Zn-dependent protease with chaperone function
VNFFEHQDRARRQTVRLVLLFALAVVLIVGALNLVVALLLPMLSHDPQTAAPSGLFSRVPPVVYLWTTGIVLLVILGGTVYRVLQLARGGEAVAEMVGARPVSPATEDAGERRLLNVVEEMAIASGTAVPRVYLMEEGGINAFAAGYSPNEAVVAVTRGALEGLDRDRLQGVVAHEFSHILNGDMRLNIRLLGVLNGILVIGAMGLHILRGMGRGRIRSRGRGSGQAMLLILGFGVALTVIGFAGVFCGRLIKSGVSRQREFLADASAVQYTRNPAGIAGALKAILNGQAGSLVDNRHAEDLSHMFFAEGFRSRLGSWLATHPPLTERIARIDPRLLAEGARDFAAPATKAEASPGVSALAGQSEGPPPPAAVVASVGRLAPAQLAHAAILAERIPEGLRRALRSDVGATGVVLALLLHRDPGTREGQLAAMRAARDDQSLASILERREEIEALGPQLRLPLLELALPMLAELSVEARQALLAEVRAVVTADNKVSLAEFVVQTLLRHQIGPGAGRATPIRYLMLQPLLTDCGLLLSLLAHSSRMAIEARREAYGVAMEQLGVAGASLLDPKDCGLDAVEHALERLRAAMPGIKQRFLHAGATVVLADDVVRMSELELLRAVSMVLDCPMPPLEAALAA